MISFSGIIESESPEKLQVLREGLALREENLGETFLAMLLHITVEFRWVNRTSVGFVTGTKGSKFIPNELGILLLNIKMFEKKKKQS